MNNEYWTILEELNHLPVIDAHEHSRSHEQSQPLTEVTDFMILHYLGSVLQYADNDLSGRIWNNQSPDRDRFEAFRKIWPLVRYTGYGRMVEKMLKQWNISADFDDQSYDRILEHARLRSPAQSRQVYMDRHIVATVTHYLAHPCGGGMANVADFFASKLVFDDHFHPLLGTPPMHLFTSKADIGLIEQAAGRPVASLPDLVAAVDGIIDRAVKMGVVGLKDHSAYTRGTGFGEPDEKAASGELDRLLKGEEFPGWAIRLSDYMLDKIVQASIDQKVPMVIHTGYLVGSADPKSNLRHFIPVIQKYPKARFDLYHLNYPWFEDLIAVLKRFPNTWANCCWTQIIDPEYTIQFLKRAVSTIPHNHIFGFGGDFQHMPEPTAAHLDVALENIAAALSSLVAHQVFSRSAALDLAKMWLHDNAASFYRLPE